MKLIIDIPEEVYKTGTLCLYFDCYSMKLHETILNGTPIPDNATNGDMIKAIFPNTTFSIPYHQGLYDKIDISRSWWNALYQKGGKRDV